MIRPLHAAVLMTLFPDFQPGELLKGAMTREGLLEPGDKLSAIGRVGAMALIEKAAQDELERKSGVSVSVGCSECHELILGVDYPTTCGRCVYAGFA